MASATEFESKPPVPSRLSPHSRASRS
jgi:hypothetical protein